MSLNADDTRDKRAWARATATTRFVNLHRKTWVPTGSNLASFALRKTMTRRVCHCAVVISRLSTTAGTESWARLAINDTSSAECYKTLRDLKRSTEILRNLNTTVRHIIMRTTKGPIIYCMNPWYIFEIKLSNVRKIALLILHHFSKMLTAGN